VTLPSTRSGNVLEVVEPVDAIRSTTWSVVEPACREQSRTVEATVIENLEAALASFRQIMVEINGKK